MNNLGNHGNLETLLCVLLQTDDFIHKFGRIWNMAQNASKNALECIKAQKKKRKKGIGKRGRKKMHRNASKTDMQKRLWFIKLCCEPAEDVHQQLAATSPAILARSSWFLAFRTFECTRESMVARRSLCIQGTHKNLIGWSRCEYLLNRGSLGDILGTYK